MITNIVQGKLKKLASEVCLLDQKWFKDQNQKVTDVLNNLVLKLGEKISII